MLACSLRSYPSNWRSKVHWIVHSEDSGFLYFSMGRSNCRHVYAINLEEHMVPPLPPVRSMQIDFRHTHQLQRQVIMEHLTIIIKAWEVSLNQSYYHSCHTLHKAIFMYLHTCIYMLARCKVHEIFVGCNISHLKPTRKNLHLQ